MIATKPSPPLAEAFGRRRRWWPALALFAFAPKCLLCLAAYVGLGTAFLGGPELCGASAAARGATTGWFSVGGAAVGVVGSLSLLHRRRRLARP